VLGDLQAERSVAIKRRQIVLTNVSRLAQSIDVPPPQITMPDKGLQRQAVPFPQFDHLGNFLAAADPKV
jgi:hypothetical protein